MAPIYFKNARHIYLPDYNIIINKEIIRRTIRCEERIEIEEIEISKDKIVKEIKKLSQVQFELTQKCNMNCKYCTFGPHYPYQRSPSNKSLSFEIAKKAIDLVYKFIKDRSDRTIAISFYGGEPTLNFECMKKIVEYSKNRFINWDISYHITTNGTLLSDEIINFLISNNFRALISLDGPAEIHNSKRVFGNGSGSYDNILNNLRKIREKSRLYYEKNIKFSCVFSPDLSLMKIYDFFTKNRLVFRNTIFLSFVNRNFTNYYNTYPCNEDLLSKDLDLIKKHINNKRKLTPLDLFISDQLSQKLLSNCLKYRRFTSLFGACYFNNRLFIDVSGNFHVCHMINDKFSFGNASDGFNFSKMQNILETYTGLMKKRCYTCDVRFLCQRCYATFAKDGCFEIEDKFCESSKRGIINGLANYIRLKKVDESSIYDKFFKQSRNFVGNINSTAQARNKLQVNDRDVIFNRFPKPSRIRLNVSIKDTESKKIKKFHQFIVFERGPKNTAIIDFLKKNIYQIKNRIIDHFVIKKDSNEIPQFIKFAEKEGLLITVSKDVYVPYYYHEFENNRMYDFNRNIILEVEDGVNIEDVKTKFSRFEIEHVYLYRDKEEQSFLPSKNIIEKIKNFNACIKLNQKIIYNPDKFSYSFNLQYNSCWGRKIAITKDRKVRPCVYSEIAIADIENKNIDDYFRKIEFYWTINKDKITKCKDCELRYVCFDCREIVWRKKKDLFSTNPYCDYDPYSGKWHA